MGPISPIEYNDDENKLITEFHKKYRLEGDLIEKLFADLKPLGHSIKTVQDRQEGCVWERYVITNSSNIPREQLQGMLVRSRQRDPRVDFGVEVTRRTVDGGTIITVVYPSGDDRDLWDHYQTRLIRNINRF